MEFQQSLVPLLHHASLPSGVVSDDGPHTLVAFTWDRVERLRDRYLQESVLAPVINELGKASAQAQGLKQVITAMTKFQRSTDRIYLHCTLPHTVNGLLRVGEKRLFIRDEVGAIKEITPSCVLDFYVHESRQRSGFGRQLFEFMLAHEKAAVAAKFGYDRPSPKLLAFLAKHYGLHNYVPQNNNFVVYRKYFAKDQPNSTTSATGPREVKNASATQSSQPAQQQQPPSQQQSRSSYAPFPGASPPPGQASFAHYDPTDGDAARSLQYDDRDLQRGSERPSGTQPASSPTNNNHSRYSTTSSSTYSAQPASAARATPPGRDERDASNRLARAGINVVSTSNLHQQQAQPQHQQRGTHSSAAAQNFQSPFSPTNQQQQQSSSQQQQQPPSPSHSHDRSSQYPPQRTTQYHQHNILTGYQQSTGHGSFANPRAAPPAANFLPDGMQVAPEISIERKTNHSGIQRRPLLDPAPNGLKQVDRSISQLENAIRDKEATLAGQPKYAIPYRQPSDRDSGWSKAASYQRMQDTAGTHPTTVSMATPYSENHAQYSNPTHSTMVGGAQSQYAMQAPAAVGRSPFAYGAVGGRR